MLMFLFHVKRIIFHINFLFKLSLSRAGYLTLYGNEDKNYEDPTSQAKDRTHSLEVYNAFYKLDRFLMKAARSMLSSG